VFQTAAGVIIPSPEKIKEEYQIFDNRILFNISFEKLETFIDEFVTQLVEPLFFVLELPLSRDEESEVRMKDTDPFHKKVCYLDGQSRKQIKEIFNLHGELLLNDGMSWFAVYSHDSNDGIYIQKYKVASIYSYEPTKYAGLLKRYGLDETEKLFTVWDTFSYETPGEALKIEIDGRTVYDVYSDLQKLGMYVAKIVPE